jgi:GGDEF domain-containing protein
MKKKIFPCYVMGQQKPFANCVAVGKTIYISGMNARSSETGEAVSDTIEGQTWHALQQINQAMKDAYKEKLKEIEGMKEEALLLSYTDDLTGIYNHRFFIQQLTLEVERQSRYASPLSLLMIDIDYFKHYNDIYIHKCYDWPPFLQRTPMRSRS